MIAALETQVKNSPSFRYTKPGCEWFSKRGREMLSTNRRVADHHATAVVLARLLLLQSCTEHFGERMSPALWLWMQLYPHYIFPSHPGESGRASCRERVCRYD